VVLVVGEIMKPFFGDLLMLDVVLGVPSRPFYS